jgi:iron complex outermembrane receptor protein
VQVYYIDEQITTPFPSYRTIIPARTIFDVKLFLMWNENFRLEAFVNNVFDKSYIAAQIQDASSADGGYLYGAPRVFGIRGTYQFE